MVKIFTAVPAGDSDAFPSLSFEDGVNSSLHRVRCALGKGGVVPSDLKREGDGASPAGVWPIREVFYRPDRVSAPQTALRLTALTPEDGWCDDPASPDYNRLVRLPFAASHEKLWRDDHAYDIVVVLGYNDDPPVAGKGSAIFLHLAQPDWRGTEGCVAVSLDSMLALLRTAAPGDAVRISF